MSKSKPPPWQFPAIVSGIVIALGALGTFIVRSATYIQLPEKVAEAMQKNAEQDSAIDKLTAIQETWQNIYQQQQAPNQPAPRGLREWDGTDEVFYCCPLLDQEACYAAALWRVCE